MKKLLLTLMTLTSFNALAQSYLILNNGVVLTTDTQGFVYDYANFVMPHKVTINGGHFLVENDELSTIGEDGSLFAKGEKIKAHKGKGANYLILEDDKIITVQTNGFFNKFKDQKPVFKKADRFGGNFFTAGPEIFTVSSRTGFYSKLDVPGLKVPEITDFGGNYFKVGTLVYTVDNKGFIYSKPDFKVGPLTKLGGNFFVDAEKHVFTVTEDGLLLNPALPKTLDVTKVTKLGQNYMLDSEGRMFTVDKKGNVNERFLTHDLKGTKVISK